MALSKSRKLSDSAIRKERRRRRVRAKISGTAERPRLAVFKSNTGLYAQIIDDVAGKTLVSASSKSKELKGKIKNNAEGAKTLGAAVAEKAKAANISEVVFDRGGFVYHGRVKAIADGAREAGLKF